MKKLVLVMLAASALAATAAPATAQPYDGYGREERYDRYDRYDRGGYDRGDRRADGLEWRIDRAAQRGQIDWRYAAELKRQVRSAEHQAYRYRADGRYTSGERAIIQARLARVADRLDRATSRNYGSGYGYDDYRR